MTRMILVRHAESVWNVEQRYQGQQDSGLTPHGRVQAHRVGALLCAEYPAVDAVWSSDLPRVRDTAAPYAQRCGVPVVYQSRLREVDIGSWAGRRLDDVAAELPGLVSAVAAGEDVRRGGGETFAETRQRVVDCLSELAERTDGTVLVFTHGGPIRVAAAHAVGVPSPGHLTLGPPGNCSRTIIELERSRTRLLEYNVTLPDPVVPDGTSAAPDASATSVPPETVL